MTRSTPSHPGASIREDCVEALGLSIAEAAKHRKIAAEALAAICEERAPITPDLAVRFEQAFGSTGEFWLRAQARHDLARVRRSCDRIERIN